MADNSGLPPIESNSSELAPILEVIYDQIGLDPVMGPTSKDIMVGGGALFVLAIVFFIIRNAFVNYLVGNLKRSPNNAGLAAWGLFGGLLFGSAIGCVAIVSKSFLTIFYIAPLALVSLICFLLCLIVASKK